MAGPLIRWIYHPWKTPSLNQRDALRALPSLPQSGTGVQSDVLSISHMIEEAQRLARRGQVYLILITDCAWNVSFPEVNQRGKDEVAGFFEMTRQDYGDRLNTTVVALGVPDLHHPGVCGLEPLFDKIIPVPDVNLTNPDAVAQQVGLYVAAVMQERRSLLARR
jgi:hypothetical protein